VSFWMPRLVKHDVVCARNLEHQGEAKVQAIWIDAWNAGDLLGIHMVERKKGIKS
jgi:hypothetical protein